MCALSSQQPPRPQIKLRVRLAQRIDSNSNSNSNQTKLAGARPCKRCCYVCYAVSMYCFALLHASHCHCCVSLPCYSLQPTALPSVEITKLDSHLRYCTLTATPPAFHHSAQAATPMPVASLRLLTRLDSAATAALPGMLSDRHPQACSTSTRSLCARRSLQGRLFPCQPRSERRMHPALACPCYRFAPSNLAAPRPGNTSFVRCVSYCRCP